MILQLFLYLIWTLIDRLPLQDQSPQREIWMVIVAYLFCTLLVEPIRLRKYRLKDLIRYPPVWTAVVFGLMTICVLDQWLPGFLLIKLPSLGVNNKISPTWLILLAATTAVLNRSVRLTWRSDKGLPDQTVDNRNKISESKRWIASGEQPITVQGEDLFSRAGVAETIEEHIRSNERTTALLGPMGSGKSSILNMAFENVAKTCPNMIIVRSDLWKASSPEYIPQIIINDIVKMLDEVCDTVGLRGIPLAYKRLAAAEPSGILDRFLNFEKNPDSLHQIDGICSVLEALDRRIVLVIEDSERLPIAFDLAHTSRFLWAIRGIARCTTIIAIDPQRTKMDFAKLCDTIERVPAMPIEQTVTILNSLYDHWTSHYGDRDTHPNRERSDKLELGMIKRQGVQAYLLGAVHSVPIRMLATLLNTPRIMKKVLHRVDLLWNQLHGEVDLDDLVILTVLRSSAPDVFQFIVTNIETSRKTSDGLEDGLLEQFQKQWEKTLRQDPNADAVRRLVDLLGIPQLTAPKAPNPKSDASLQGVHLDEQPDYFARIIAGQIPSREARDQDVLRDIESSHSGHSYNLAKRLVQSATSDDGYISSWKRFSKPTAEELFGITDAVIDILLLRDGSSVNPDDPVLVTLAYRLHECLDDDGGVEIENWIESQASRNGFKSLSLSSGLLTFSIRVCPRNEGTDVMRRISRNLLDQISQKIVSSQDIPNVLSGNYPWTLRLLLSDISTKEEAHNIRLIPLILKAAETHGNQIIPQLAYSVVYDSAPRPVESDSGDLVGVVDSGISFDRLNTVFGGRESDVLQLLSKYSGSDNRCIQVKKAAIKRLGDLEHGPEVSHSEM